MGERMKTMNIRELEKQIRQYDNTPDGYSDSLRLDLSEIVLRHLEGGMTQVKLANKAGIKPQMITRIVHAVSNCTFETAGKILFALGVKAKLTEVLPRHTITVDGGVVKFYRTDNNQKTLQEIFDSSKVGINNETEKIQEVYTG